MNAPAYDLNERIRFNKQLTEVERAPLAERKEAAAAWLESLTTSPEWVAEKIGWLLDGSYGYGAYQAARDVITHKRMNRRAWLGQTIAALEWQCPNNYARAAWNKLSSEQQAALNAMIDREIEAVEEEV